MTDQNITSILNELAVHYPTATIALNYSNPWELLVAVILSAQCTDIRVNIVTSKLFRKYPAFKDYIRADLAEFEQDIKSTGFFHNKAKNILATAKIINDRYNGNVPETMEELLTLPGVARKTANVVLGNAYHKVEGIAVDTHVHRISQRLRLIDPEKSGGKKKILYTSGGKELLDYYKDADPNKIEQQLMQTVPREEWFKLTYRIIDHGRAICKAKNPNCGECPLFTFCPVRRT